MHVTDIVNKNNLVSFLHINPNAVQLNIVNYVNLTKHKKVSRGQNHTQAEEKEDRLKTLQRGKI